MAGKWKRTAPKDWSPWPEFTEPRRKEKQAAVDRMIEETARSLYETMTAYGLTQKEQEKVLYMAAAFCGLRLHAPDQTAARPGA